MRFLFSAFTILICLSIYSASAQVEQTPIHEIKIGDTREAVIAKWGKPAQKDRVYKVGDRREVWVYTCELQTPCPRDCDWYYELPCSYLFFVNDKLTAVEDVR